MQFTSLKLAGFKSFVDPAEFKIEPGLTGVVGPNGCGKSNILESLRWVMGANSAKAMRAGAMDDVIFSGTGNRPARNHADVILTIDNSDRQAPASFNDDDVLEVSRRITRGAGSTYRINGREVRARDVQLLFADASTGANSPALVRQGQISELISAKPQNRRRILEEAAGISGLHNRRHEAELRLRAAEANLARLEDVFGEIEAQHAQLKRQVRAAARYRKISATMRALEAFAAHLRWSEAQQQVQEQTARLAALQGEAADLAARAAKARADIEGAGDGLEDLRTEEAVAAALVARISAAQETIERDSVRARERLAELETRLAEIARDRLAEEALGDDGAAALARLQDEAKALKAGDDDNQAIENLTRMRDETARAREEAEQALSVLRSAFGERAARRRSAEQEVIQAEQGQVRARDEVRRAEEACAQNQGDLADQTAQEEADAQARAAQDHLEKVRTAHGRCEDARLAAERHERQAREDFDQARRAFEALQAESQGLEKALAVQAKGDWPAIADSMTVAPGYERALAAALGDDLQASLDDEAPVRWGAVNAAPPKNFALPPDTRALGDFVQAPPALALRLAAIGLVEAKEGDRLAGSLLPGQRLVSREGGLWRWDGLQVQAGAEPPGALRLEQRNRLKELSLLVATADKKAQEARDLWQEARQASQAARADEKQKRAAIPDAEQQARKARAIAEESARRLGAAQARAQALNEALARWQEALAECDEAVRTAKDALAALPEDDEEEMAASLHDAQERAEAARNAAADAQGALRAHEREAQARATRLDYIAREEAQWRTRLETSAARLSSLSAREEETKQKISKESAAPEALEARRQEIMDSLAQAETRRRLAADQLAKAQNKRRDAEASARDIEAQAARAGEARAAAQARLQADNERLAEICEHIRNTLQCAPEALAAMGEGLDKTPQDAHQADGWLETLRRQRDSIGPVNLRAEEEGREVEERLQEMTADRDDLVKAIARLRRGIDSLNSEGRTRLLAAFDEVNGHFQSLFTTLFGGGQAELRLTESDDPLEAGLEVFASPPGKKLDTMTLMSGGEQSLTAVALIFAVFLSNPAPVCVLDEVEAPLDDANVERFCTLLHEMRRRTRTRFVVITHNAVTMARVDRLFGVTMAERGVSQLVSVNLQRAERLAAAQ